MQRSYWITAAPVVLIIVAGILLSLPALLYGPLPGAHDAVEHLARLQGFNESLWSGRVYPRWIIDVNAGLGSPVFYVYGPFPYLPAALLRPLASTPAMGLRTGLEFDVSLAFALIGSGAALYSWLRRSAGTWPSLLAAVIYMALPYHLWCDFYCRAAIAEVWTFAWMPLILRAIDGVVESRRHAMIGLAASYLLLITTHLPVVLMFSPVALAYVLWRTPAGRRTHCVSRVAGGLILGTGMAAAYLVPALAHQRYFSGKMGAHYYYANNFLVLNSSLLTWDAFHNQINWYVTWIAVVMLFLVVALVLYIFVLGEPAPSGCGKRGPAHIGDAVDSPDSLRFLTDATPWLITSFASVFLMTSLSRPVWRLLPLLQQIQFPWRFHTVLTLAASAITALAAAAIREQRPRSRRFGVALIVLILLFCATSYLHVWRLHFKQASREQRALTSRVAADTLSSTWMRCPDRDLLTGPAMREIARSVPEVRLLTTGGVVSILLWRSGDIRVRVNAPVPTSMVVRQLYYPAWRALSVEENSMLPVEPGSNCLISVRVPPGERTIRLTVPFGLSEKLGTGISVFSLLVFLFFLAKPGLR